jgi:hypothetical protein
MPLTNADRHYWSPVPEVVDWLAAKYQGKRVLEIGPGHTPFPAATHFVDWQEIPGVPLERTFRLDVGREPLPTLGPWDPEVIAKWDFVYARHVLEDMANPFHLISEMSRVAKAGYIETPSPICELARGVDGSSPVWRGYNHHRWLVWDNGDALTFVAKFPLVEYTASADEGLCDQMLRGGPRYWNTYFLWEDDIKVSHLQSPHDFVMPQDYGATLLLAKGQSKASTDKFFGNLNVA